MKLRLLGTLSVTLALAVCGFAATVSHAAPSRQEGVVYLPHPTEIADRMQDAIHTKIVVNLTNALDATVAPPGREKADVVTPPAAHLGRLGGLEFRWQHKSRGDGRGHGCRPSSLAW